MPNQSLPTSPLGSSRPAPAKEGNERLYLTAVASVAGRVRVVVDVALVGGR